MDLSDETKTGEGESSGLDDEALSADHSSQDTDDTLSLWIADPEDEATNSAPELPRFRSLHPSRADSNQALDSALRRLPDAFTPTRPKFVANLFSGRHQQFERIITAIEENHSHVVLDRKSVV